MRLNYWSCSKFSDLIRGSKKPFALELGKWDDWAKEQKSKSPIRFWMAEEGLSKLQDFVMFPSDVYRATKNYIHKRWTIKTHYLKTGLKPGEYYDLDHRIIHGLFNELVDFVEIECARFAKRSRKKYIIKNGRSAEAGLDYIDWSSTEKIDIGEKIKELYFWWKIRSSRPEEYLEDSFQEDTKMLIELIKIRHELWT